MAARNEWQITQNDNSTTRPQRIVIRQIKTLINQLKLKRNCISYNLFCGWYHTYTSNRCFEVSKLHVDNCKLNDSKTTVSAYILCVVYLYMTSRPSKNRGWTETAVIQMPKKKNIRLYMPTIQQ